jgi:cell division protein FtsB
MASSRASTRPARIRRRSVTRRWIAVGVLVAIGLAYVQPVRSYLDSRGKVGERRAEVAKLEAEHRALEREIEVAETPVFVEREARKLGFVRPGERLFVVTGDGR